MRVLVAGGSRFIGRNLVEFLLGEGHDVTLFNRGKTNPGLFPDVREIHGDRAAPPAALARHDWDWVFDLSCYTPEAAEKLVYTVGPRTARYVFCSTISVYDWDGSDTPICEDAPRIPYTPENTGLDVPRAVAYGARKAAAEEVVLGLAPAVGMEATVVRPSLVYGPWDPTDRLHWWLYRVQQGAVVLPAGNRGMVHAVYVKDLARIFMAAAKGLDSAGRIYHGAAMRHASLKDWINTAALVVGKRPRIGMIPDDDLMATITDPLPGLTGPNDLILSTQRLEREFSFTSTPLVQTIAETLAHMARENRTIKEALPLKMLETLIA